jgi:AcrR family transcriptional regulator
MNETRSRIIETAIQLFNEHGVQHVRLQQIADQAGISVGNLAYHFHDKKEILKKVIINIDDQLQSAFQKPGPLQQFIDFDNQLSRQYHFLNKYAFYFLDMVDVKRFYPDIHEGRIDQIEQYIHHLHKWLEANVEREMLMPEKRPGQYRDLSKMIWFIGAFWMSKKRILEDDENYELKYKEMIWQQLEPFFTSTGQSEFEIVISPGLS